MRAPQQIARWTGNAEDFAQKIRTLGRSQANETPVIPIAFAAPILHENAPTTNESHGLAILENGEISTGMNAFKNVNVFLKAKAFGYHVTTAERLPQILKNGWLTNQEPTSSESARTPGLHLSTHLGVTYSVGGGSVILRTPLNTSSLENFPSSSYYGHVRTLLDTPANLVPKILEFSPDRGVSWYPMNDVFVSYLNKGLLPTFRGRPIYPSN